MKAKTAINMLKLLIQDIKEFNKNMDKRLQFLEILYLHKVNCCNQTCLCIKYMEVLNEVIYNNFNSDYVNDEEKSDSLSKKIEVKFILN